VSEDIDPAARAAYDWTHLTRDIAVSTSLTLHDASKLTSQLQHGFTLSEGLKVTMLGHVVPYDIAQPLIRLLEAARSGEYATVGANLRALMTQAQDAVRPHPDPANEGQH
jgi:hypothetical protein